MLSADADAFVPSVAKANLVQQLQLHSPSPEQARGVLLVASISGVLERLDVSGAAESLSLVTDEGKTVAGINTICRYVASIGARREQLLGASPEVQAQVQLQLCTNYCPLAAGVLPRRVNTLVQGFACDQWKGLERGICSEMPKD